MDTDRYSTLMNKELERLVSESAAGKSERDPVELDQQSIGRLSRMDALQVQAMAQETERRRQIRIQILTAALKRIAQEEFGTCVTCGEDIVPARLDFDPAVATCIDCAGGKSR